MGISGTVVDCSGFGTRVVPGVGGGQYCTRQQSSVWLGTIKQFDCTGKVGHLYVINNTLIAEKLIHMYGSSIPTQINDLPICEKQLFSVT